MEHSVIKTAALYIRVSTDKQEELSPDSQKKLLKEYAAKNNYLTSEEFTFMDNGISGRKADKRPQFQKMIGYAKSKEHPFDAILVWKFSRFARNQEESIVYKNMLRKDGVEVVSISEPLIDGPFGDLIERIIEWMDEYYSIRLSGEVIRGMTESAERGRYISAAPFGYDLSKTHTGLLVVNEAEAAVVRDIYDRYIRGQSTLSIAKYLNRKGILSKRGNPFENRSVQRILENPVYNGTIVWRGIARKGIHQPIIDDGTYRRATDIVKIRKRRPPKSRPDTEYCHMLSSLVKCGNCGASMSITVKGYLQCVNYNHGLCTVSHHVPERVILEALNESLLHIATGDGTEYIAVMPKESHAEELEALRASLASIQTKERRIKDAYVNGIDSLEEYKENRNILERERGKLQKQIKEIHAASEDDADLEEYSKKVRNVYDLIHCDQIDFRKKNLALKSIIDKIIYSKPEQKVTIYYYAS